MYHSFSLIAWQSGARILPKPLMFQKLIQYLESLKNPTCRLVRLNPDATLPAMATQLAAGYDLTSVDAVCLEPQQRCLVHTGIRASIPAGYHMEIRPRSGLALKHGVTVLNSPGTIDADYRGEIMVLLINLGDRPYAIAVGDRIAQIVMMRHSSVHFEWAESLDKTDRDVNGFGSTGN